MIRTLESESKPQGLSKQPAFENDLGALYVGPCEMVLDNVAVGEQYKGKVQLLFTSPPFPLNQKKKYGNLNGKAYVEWLGAFAPLFAEYLAPTGSVVIELGNAWESGSPTQSILPYQALLHFLETGKFHLCQEITYYNPARLPTPAQWVTIERIRLKDSTSKVWWMSKTKKPRADNRRVLKPYSKSMNKLLEKGSYNAGRRPSEHVISETGFLKDNAGAIPSNLIEIANTHTDASYHQFCKDNGMTPHPARMPQGLAEFFIKFLTEEGDIVLDPFSGSNTTGAAANQLGRRWLSIEVMPEYAFASVARFDTARAVSLLNELRGHAATPPA